MEITRIIDNQDYFLYSQISPIIKCWIDKKSIASFLDYQEENLLEMNDDGKISVKPIEVNINLPKGEFCYFQEKVDLYEERIITKRVSFRGPTLRLKIIPGVYYRAGNLNIGRKTENEYIKIDSGFLYITSKRLLFTGSGKNKTIPFNKIIDFKIHSGGIEVVKDSGKNQYFTLKNKQKIFAAQLIQHFIKN